MLTWILKVFYEKKDIIFCEVCHIAYEFLQ